MIYGEELPASLTSEPIEVAPTPYKISSLFDEQSLPRALLADHALKSGVWGVVRVEEGKVHYLEHGVPDPRILEPGIPAVIPPDTKHSLELIGAVKLRVEFYDRYPLSRPITFEQGRN
jgi:tellurite resistance-related uncharacterized protein